MKRQKILFPTDFSPASTDALRYVLQYADDKKATIDLLHVLPHEYQAGAIMVEATKNSLRYATKKMRRQLEKALTQIETNKILDQVPDINTKVEFGAPKDVIAQLANAQDYDLIAIGTKGESGRLLGSFTSALVAKSRCNILVIPESCSYKDIRKIVFATDYQKTDPYYIFELLETMHFDAPKIHCLHVAQSENNSEIKARLDQFYKRHMPLLMLDMVERKGANIEGVIKGFAREQEANLIAMVSPKHDFLERIFYKSHTKKMTGTTDLPLLVLKE